MHIWESQINTSVPLDHRTTTIAQIFYAISIVSVTGTVLASPWISPIYSTEAAEPVPSSGPNPKRAIHLRGINNSVFVTGLTYTVFWCLLQLLLQQPVKAIPVLLILLQIISSIAHFSLDKTLHEQWVQVNFFKYLIYIFLFLKSKASWKYYCYYCVGCCNAVLGNGRSFWSWEYK